MEVVESESESSEVEVPKKGKKAQAAPKKAPKKKDKKKDKSKNTRRKNNYLYNIACTTSAVHYRSYCRLLTIII